MPTTAFDVESIKQSIVGKLQRYNGVTVQEATPQQLYKAVASTVRDQIMQKWMGSCVMPSASACIICRLNF